MTYSFNYDLRRDTFLQQRYLGYYNAQCCGFGVEYQTYNFANYSTVAIPQDRRFNVSFTLAGIGTFSNFLGAFGGQSTRRSTAFVRWDDDSVMMSMDVQQ